MSLGTVGMVIASVPSFLLPSSGWSFFAELSAYLAMGGVVALLLLPFVRLPESAGAFR